LDSSSGGRYFLENLELSSSFSRVVMLDTEMVTSRGDIALLYSELGQFCKQLSATGQTTERIKLKLSYLKDIRNSLSRLTGEKVPDDIEFFEIKSLAMLSEDIRELLKETDIDCIRLPLLSQVEEILDPDKNRITSFYIYDSYSSKLADLRKALKKQRTSEDRHTNYECVAENEKKLAGDTGVSFRNSSFDLIQEISELEDSIRRDLAKKLLPYAQQLEHALLLLAKTDILLSKATQIDKLGLIIPEISDKGIFYKGLFNPEVVEILEKEQKRFQKIDIDFDAPLLITGANMGGKSLTLKTLALTQYLFQFGFGIPASEACIVPVDEVFLSIGDEQNYKLGLSSFAAEMKRINESLTALKSKKREQSEVLILIDEPARTTNPHEGTALATALITIFVEYNALSVVTTHYNIEDINCKRLRVRGFEEEQMNYTLIPDTGGDVPKEAIRIALSLGVDGEWLDLAKKILAKD